LYPQKDANKYTATYYFINIQLVSIMFSLF